MKNFLPTFIILFTLNGTAVAQSELAAYFGRDNKYGDVVVKKVLSADAIVITVENEDEQISLIGLKAPEVLKEKEAPTRNEYGFEIKKPTSPLTPIEKEAFDAVTELLTGKRVRLEFDVDRTTQDFKTPAYVFLKEEEDLFVNAEILKLGYADLQIRPPNTKYAAKLRSAYKEARDEKRGLQNR